MAKQKLSVEVVVGLVNKLSGPLKGLQRELRQAGRNLSIAGAGAVGGGLALLEPLREAVKMSSELSAGLTEVGIVAEVSAQKLAQIRPELRRIAEQSNQNTGQLVAGLKDLTAKGLGFDAAMAALPAIAKTSTAAGASMEDMSAAASALIDNLKIVPKDLQRTLDILTVAGNEGAFELKDMAREFPTLTAALSQIGMTGETAVSTLGSALQVVRKGAGTSAEAANNLLNFLSKLTAPTTVKNMEKQWGVDLPTAFKRWQKEGLNPVEESLRLIQQQTGGDAFKIGEVFGDMQVMNALKPLLANMKEYQRIKTAAEGGMGASAAQFARRMQDDPTQQWTRLTILAGNLADRLGTALLPVLGRIADAVAPIVEAVGSWIDANPELATTIALVVGGLGALLVIVGPVLLALGGIAAAISMIGPVTGGVILALLALRAGFYLVWKPIHAFFVKLWGDLEAGAQRWRAAFDDLIARMLARGRELLDYFLDLPARMSEIGGRIVDGIWSGFENKWNAFRSWVSGIAESIPTVFEDVLGIQSPSKVFKGIGENVVRGLQIGLAGAGGLAAMPSPAAMLPAPMAISMPISVSITAPAGTDAQTLAALVRREVTAATSQAARKIGALYDSPDGL